MDRPSWKRRLALTLTVTTTIFGLVAFVANSQRMIELVQDYVPASVGRFLPSSAAARFNQGAAALLTNRFITDERLDHYFGRPMATARASTPHDFIAVVYQTSYGNAYVERRNNETLSAVIASKRLPLPPAVHSLAAASKLPINVELGVLLKDDLGDELLNSGFIASDSSEFFLMSKRPGRIALGYSFPSFVNCGGRDSVSTWLGYNAMSGSFKDCQATNPKAEGTPFFAARIFDDADLKSDAISFLWLRASEVSPEMYRR